MPEIKLEGQHGIFLWHMISFVLRCAHESFLKDLLVTKFSF